MITLYHAPQSRSSRIVWLLEELNTPYDIRPVSIFRPMTGQGTGDPANPHPDKRVPMIADGEVHVAESIAIVLYLTDAFPDAGLGASVGDRRRGEYLTWLVWYAAEMEPAMMASLTGTLAASPPMERALGAVAKRLEAMLSRSEYALGDSFSSVDLVLASALDFGRRAFPASAAIDDYVIRCKSRPAAVRSRDLDSATGVQRPR